MGNALHFEKVGREVPPVVLQKVGRVPAVAVASVLENEVKHSPRFIGARGPRGMLGEPGRRGRRGGRGAVGEHGPIGPIGITGPPGDDGEPGKDGAKGPRGGPGLKGRQGAVGPKGDTGPAGPIGPVPRHKWKGTRLSFELPDGTFGRSVQLQGPGGGRGRAGSGGAGTREVWETIQLTGTDLEFVKGGGLGPDTIVDLSSLAGGGGNPWLEFVPQAANPGTIPGDTLYQDDGTNYTSGSLVWGDLTRPAVFGPNFSIGNPGTEQGGINVNGVNYDAVAKINSVGGALDASLILHRHSTSFPANLTFARSNSDTVAHAAVTLGQTLGSHIYTGWTGSHYDIGAVIDARVAPTGTVGAGSLPTELAFFTTPDGADAASLAMIIGRDQVIYGGIAVGAELTLRGSQDAALGRVRIQSGVVFDSIAASTAVYAFDYNATEVYGGAFVGGGLNMSGDITTGASTFIYESFRGAPIIRTAFAPGFAAYTVLQALPNLRAGAAAGLNPLAPLILNAGPTVENAFAGTKSVATSAIINGSPTVKASLTGAVMNVTNVTGMTWAPKYSTVAGSSISFGTVRGLHCQNPAAGLFQPGAGVESMVAYYGVDVAAIAFGGNVPKAALRSAIAPATNARFLLNNGNAVSEFGTGHIYFDDNAGVVYGGNTTTWDVWQSWNTGSGGYFRTMFLANGDSLRWTNPANNRWLFDNDGGSTDGEYNFNCAKFSLGAQTGAVGNQVGVFVTGARSTQVGGEWADFLLTHGANVTVDHAMGGVFGWAINAPSITIGTGSVTTAGALTVGGNVNQGSVNRFGVRILSNPSGGAGVNAALWVTAGRTQLDGILAHGAANLGFYGTAPIAQPAGVAVTAAGIHAALVALGLIT